MKMMDYLFSPIMDRLERYYNKYQLIKGIIAANTIIQVKTGRLEKRGLFTLVFLENNLDLFDDVFIQILLFSCSNFMNRFLRKVHLFS